MTKKALLIEDDARLRSEIAAALSAEGWELRSVPGVGAAAALSEADAGPFSMVILPVTRADLGRLSALARSAFPGCLVVALADLDARASLRAAVSSQTIDEFLPLPFSPSDMKNLSKMAKRGDA